MDIVIEEDKGTFVVSASGKVDAANCGQLEEVLNDIIIGGGTTIILNLEGLVYISSAGLRVLLKTAKKLFGSGKMALCALSENVNEIIEMSGFVHFMDIFPDTDKAKATLKL